MGVIDTTPTIILPLEGGGIKSLYFSYIIGGRQKKFLNGTPSAQASNPLSVIIYNKL